MKTETQVLLEAKLEHAYHETETLPNVLEYVFHVFHAQAC